MMIRRSYDFLKSVELLAPDNLLSFSSAVLLTDLRMRCMTLLWCDLIEIVERVLQGHASDAAEARLLRELLQLPFRQTHRAKPLPMAGERGGHAIEHTEAIEQAPQGPGIAFQALGAIDVQAHIASIRAQRLANGSQQATRVDGIVDDIEGGNHIILFGQACGDVAMLEAHPVGDPCCLGLCDSRLEDVIPDVARAREGLRQLDQRLATTAADIGYQRALFQPG